MKEELKYCIDFPATGIREEQILVTGNAALGGPIYDIVINSPKGLFTQRIKIYASGLIVSIETNQDSCIVRLNRSFTRFGRKIIIKN